MMQEGNLYYGLKSFFILKEWLTSTFIVEFTYVIYSCKYCNTDLVITGQKVVEP
jgi:hypothetical protein